MWYVLGMVIIDTIVLSFCKLCYIGLGIAILLFVLFFLFYGLGFVLNGLFFILIKVQKILSFSTKKSIPKSTQP